MMHRISNISTRPCEQDNKSFVSIKGGDFLHQLTDYQLLKMDFGPWS
jgi:hypothetical protein